MQLTANLEKVLMHYIFRNPLYLRVVKPHYFRNADVQLVYGAVRQSYLDSVDHEMPSLVEIFDLVKMADKEGAMSSELIKSVLRVDLSQYRSETLEKYYQSIVLSNALKDGLTESIVKLREADPNDLASIQEAAAAIKEIVQASATVVTSDGGLGSNFDEPESHNQDAYANKVPTGWKTMDHLVGGGWDRKTFNVLMGETNVGKSVWLQNVAKNAANNGYNVVYITLEMSEKKTIKRIGSMRLDIPIADYDALSKDAGYIAERLAWLKRKYGGKQGLFEDRLGAIYIKEYPAASATPETLEGYVKLWQETTGQKLDMLVVDYIGIMSPGPGAPKDNLYQKGKMLAEGLRALGQRYDLVVVTATQISKESWGAGDINLNSIPESKAIAETADSVWAIIRTAPMKAAGQYILKALKLRDSNFEYDRMGFDLNRINLNIHNDRVVEIAQPS
jgi:replicative DNA helicase